MRTASLRSSAVISRRIWPVLGVFDAAGGLGRGLAEDFAGLQAAVGPHDDLHAPAERSVGSRPKTPPGTASHRNELHSWA